MDIQLHRKGTNNYCFITEQVTRARGRKRGEIKFCMEFVQFVKTHPNGDGDNVPTETRVLGAHEFACWWESPANADWRITDC